MHFVFFLLLHPTPPVFSFFFFNDTATTEIYTLSLHDALPISFNSGTADANGNITPWHLYRQEIIAFNVLTGKVRRLAHHRSRSVFNDYFASPRLSASWGGKYVGFASNFNQSGVNDIYVIPFSATSDTTSPTVSSTLPNRGLPRSDQIGRASCRERV